MLTFFTDEQTRVLINLNQHYRAWMSCEQAIAALPYNLVRKTVNGHDYLYELVDRGGNGKSLGRWSPDTGARLDAYQTDKHALQTRRDGTRTSMEESAALYRRLRLPLLASEAGRVLRAADRHRLLGSHLMVIGTNAVPAYSIEAGGFIPDLPDETVDFDMAWTATDATDGVQVIWPMLKAADPTYTVNAERSFQALNNRAYEIQILVAPSRLQTLWRTDKPMPLALPEQEWLLNGQRVDHVVLCRDNKPVRLVAPDPRWFALHKLWMSEKRERTPLKKPKDARQGLALLDAVHLAMPHYPLDAAFADTLPPELRPWFDRWYDRRPQRALPDW